MLRSRRFAFLLVCIILLTSAVAPAIAEEAILSEVPAYDWTHGCSPTAGMMIMGYWDAYSYSALIPGSNNWYANGSNIREAIATRGNGSGQVLDPGTPGTGHVGDYAYYGKVEDSKGNIHPDMSDVNPSGAHADNCLADFMGTSQSALNLWYGATSQSRISGGMEDYASWKGYSFTAGGVYSSTPTWDNFTREIQFGRPVMFSVDTKGDGKIDHSVTAIGFRDTNGYQEYACRDTWSASATPRWERFRTMSSSYDWGVGGWYTLRQTGTTDTQFQSVSGNWSNSSSWSNGIPNANSFVLLPVGKTVNISTTGSAFLINNRGTLTVEGGLATKTLRNLEGSDIFLTTGASALQVSAVFRNDGTVVQTAGNHKARDIIIVGNMYGETASYTQTAGTLTVTDTLLIGQGKGIYRLEGGQLNVGSEICVGKGQLEWFGGGIQTPMLKFSDTDGDLVMGFDFNMRDLANGSLMGGAVIEPRDDDDDLPAVQIANGAVATHDSDSLQVQNLIVGSSLGEGYYEMSSLAELRTNLYVGYEGIGEFVQNSGIVTTSGAYIGQIMVGACPVGGGPPYAGGGTGTYTLHDGQVNGKLTVGGMGTGTFTQEGGTVSVPQLIVGKYEGSQGTYTLNAGTLEKHESRDDVKIGSGGNGLFVQNGGTFTLSYDSAMYIGYDSGSTGIYEMNGGVIDGGGITIGYFGTGRFIQEGGTVNCSVGLGYSNESDAVYELRGGELIGNLSIGVEGSGNVTFIHSGGIKGGSGVRIGSSSGSEGTYRLLGTGVLTMTGSSKLVVGERGTGWFIQEGGTVDQSGADSYYSGIYLGNMHDGVGTYELRDGQITTPKILVGNYEYDGKGHFLQSGGTCIVSDYVRVGGGSKESSCVLSGGVFDTSHLCVYSNGTLSIASIAADIQIQKWFGFYNESSFTAVEGAMVHMTGSAFKNQSTNPDSLAGLGNLTLIFEGGAAYVDPFEAAGEDVGAVIGGFVTANFLLDTLQLGGTAAGKIQLVDDFDNQDDGSLGNEAVYVNNLIMNAGATIDLNGLNLYYLNIGDPKQFFCGDGDMDGDVDLSDFFTLKANFGMGNCWAEGDFDGNGDVELSDFFILKVNYGSSSSKTIPEPASASLLLLGAVAMLRRRKK
ncbi:MAG: PEP-CTERM sorting domain-containing protein [Phycisphaerae bacterium]|nr:PEP-CTERM sorting domain-containing protein [Phycisphaerae bacterium]